MKMPDITPAQIAAALGIVIAPLISFGLLDDQTAQVLITAVTGVVSAVLTVADAIIRQGRAKIAAARAGYDAFQEQQKQVP